MVKCFGKMKCRDCASIKKIPSNNLLSIPSHLLDEKGIKSNDRVKLISHPEGILIKKIE